MTLWLEVHFSRMWLTVHKHNQSHGPAERNGAEGPHLLPFYASLVVFIKEAKKNIQHHLWRQASTGKLISHQPLSPHKMMSI